MVAMVTPKTTWLFRPGIEGIPREGELTLSADGLEFAGANGRDVAIPFADIRRARRLRASPILEIKYRRDGERRIAFIFFASPPELGEWRGTPISREERKQRRIAFGFLEERNKDLKDVLDAWVAGIAERR